MTTADSASAQATKQELGAGMRANEWVALRSSLRLRLLLGTLVSIALALTVAAWALSGLFHQHVTRQFHAELRLHLDSLVSHLSLDAAGLPRLSAEESDPRFGQPYSGLYWQVEPLERAPDSPRRALRSRSLWDVLLEPDFSVPVDGEVHSRRLAGPRGTMLGALERVVTLEDDNGPGAGRRILLVVAADERLVAEPVENFAGMLRLFLGVLGAGLAAVALLQVWIAMRPLRRLRRALVAVRAGEAVRLEGDFSGEVQPLVAEFNSVLGQNAEVVERARTQAGNLAHALKTPLSVIANSAQGLSGEAGQLIVGQVEIARRQIDYHLRRARAAAAVRMPGVRTPVAPVVEGLVRVMQRVHAQRGLTFHVAGDVGATFRGEAEDLQEILGNLLDNAGKWARTEVRLAYVRDGENLALTLDDDGPGIPVEARSRVLRRGERVDERVAGSGLGLAIVDELVRLYGGSLELGVSPPGGLRLQLLLPAA